MPGNFYVNRPVDTTVKYVDYKKEVRSVIVVAEVKASDGDS